MKVVIIDSNYLFREGLKKVLSSEQNIELIGEGSDVREGVEIILNNNPDIVIMELKLRNDNGLKIVEEIRKRSITCKFIILTDSSDYKDFRKAEEFNIQGYILKDALPEEIIHAVRIVNAGKKYYDTNLMMLAINIEKKDSIKVEAMQGLTKREREVLIELSKGISNKNIAERLAITEYTVKKHVSQILLKLDLLDRTQAALYAVYYGLDMRNN
jgi:two-component system, NarL family, nitrate/nitrite response regulator NarL